MATQKTKIIDKLINIFRTSSKISKVIRGLKVLDEINDFPFACVLAANEKRIYNGAGEKIGVIETTIRAYVYSDNSLDKAEEIGVEIDSLLKDFLAIKCDNNVFDARVVTLKTDEGLFAPYGILDLQVEIFYILT